MRICVSCGRRAGDRPLQKLPLALSPDLGICIDCKDKLSRRGVESGIQRESDRVLSTNRAAFYPYMPPPVCKHCGEPVVLNTQGQQPLWCSSCERRRMQLAVGRR